MLGERRTGGETCHEATEQGHREVEDKVEAGWVGRLPPIRAGRVYALSAGTKNRMSPVIPAIRSRAQNAVRP